MWNRPAVLLPEAALIAEVSVPDRSAVWSIALLPVIGGAQRIVTIPLQHTRRLKKVDKFRTVRQGGRPQRSLRAAGCREGRVESGDGRRDSAVADVLEVLLPITGIVFVVTAS